MIPGEQILAQALSVVGPQPITYFAQSGAAQVDDAGRHIQYRDAGVAVPNASVQAVPQSRYVQLGLDRTRRYVTCFLPKSVVGFDVGATPGQIVYAGRRYSIEQVTDWFAQDGWAECLCVEVRTP